MHELSSRTRCSSVRLVSQRPFTEGVCKILEKGGGGPFGICWRSFSVFCAPAKMTGNQCNVCNFLRINLRHKQLKKPNNFKVIMCRVKQRGTRCMDISYGSL